MYADAPKELSRLIRPREHLADLQPHRRPSFSHPVLRDAASSLRWPGDACLAWVFLWRRRTCFGSLAAGAVRYGPVLIISLLPMRVDLVYVYIYECIYVYNFYFLYIIIIIRVAKRNLHMNLMPPKRVPREHYTHHRNSCWKCKATEVFADFGMNWFSLDWVGLGGEFSLRWVELHWVKVGWVGIVQIRMGFVGWVKLHWDGLKCLGWG